MISCRFCVVPLTVRDLNRPTAWGMIWKKGSWGSRGSFLDGDKLIGEDFERPR